MKERLKNSQKMPLNKLNRSLKMKKKIKSEKLNTVSSLNLVHGESLKSLIDDHRKLRSAVDTKKNKNGYIFKTKKSKISSKKISNSEFSNTYTP